MNVLVIDVGGTHVKMLATGRRKSVSFHSGRHLTPREMVRAVKRATEGWKYDVIALGYPGPVLRGRVVREPANLGKGWMRYDFRRALGKPVRIMNDAAMQALGTYAGGRMLFLGLGTGLGAAFLHDWCVDPLEIAHLPYRKGKSYEDYLGRRGLERLGRRKWERHVKEVVRMFQDALLPDYVALGGGNAHRLRRLPPKARRGNNTHAFLGGFRLWRLDPS